MYQHLGKYTSHFSTFNEPLTFTNSAFILGSHAPGQYGFKLLQRKNPELYGTDLNQSIERVPYLQALNLIKGHVIAYRTMHAMYDSKTARDKYTLKKPQVSIVLNSDWAEPLRIKGCEEQKCSYHDDDIQASKNQMDFMLGWWLHSVMFGSWPKSMNERVYINRIKTIKQPQLGQFADSSCLQEDGKPVTCSQKSQLKLTDDIRAGGTLDALAMRSHQNGDLMEGENSQHIQHVIEASERSTEEFRIMLEPISAQVGPEQNPA
ncbi:MAG: beta-glucosidase 24-like [Solimicrobium sp.]|nr:beta-glucosidase 24-like [Solimicrobium sp.]